MTKLTIHCTVNGSPQVFEAAPGASLLDVLRAAGLTAAKEGCGVGECGACTVLVNDIPVDSCIFLAAWTEGAAVRTVEGESRNGRLSSVQQAYIDAGAVQCGFCTPGLIMITTAFAEKHPEAVPDAETIRAAHAGNLCRCTGYETIVAAVRLACACRRTSVTGE